MKDRKAYGEGNEGTHHLEVWDLQDKWQGPPLEELSLSQDKTKIERTQVSLTICAKFSFYFKFQCPNTWNKAPYL